MGNVLNNPDTKKHVHLFDYNGMTGTVVSMQGWRISMEDTHIVEPKLSWCPDTSFFAVFDGHGGVATSKYCEQNIVHWLKKQYESFATHKTTSDDLSLLLSKSFVSFDQQIRDAQITESGSTAICGFITNTHYIISNLGDSRCVLCRGGEASPLSVDHKPALETEKRRIIKAGGMVIGNRVNGDLAVSRAFGDFSYKQNTDTRPEDQEVSCEPDVRVISRDDSDNYLLFACDGIWDVFPNPKELIPVLDDLLTSYETIDEAISKLLDMCLEMGSKDNITLMIVPLKQMPQPNKVKIAARLQVELQLQAIKAKEETENGEF